MIDGTEFVRSLFEITEPAVIEMQLGAIPIPPRFPGYRANNARDLDLADTAQNLAQDGLLLLYLKWIVHVLVLAAATAPKIRAGWGHARSGRRDHVPNAAAKQVILRPLHFRAHRLARQYVRKQHNAAIEMRQSVSAIHQLFYCQSLFSGQAKAYPTVTWLIHHEGT